MQHKFSTSISQLPAWCNIVHWGAGGGGNGLCNVVVFCGGAVANKNNASHVEMVGYVQEGGGGHTERVKEMNLLSTNQSNGIEFDYR